MKDKVVHESSQSDENNNELNRSSNSAIPPFNPGKFIMLQLLIVYTCKLIS